MSKRGDLRSRKWAEAQRQSTKAATILTIPIDEDDEGLLDAFGPKLCANCGEREGTIQWLGQGGMLALTHGFYSMWCEVCATRAQLVYAEERAAAIPELQRKLQELLDAPM